MQLKHTHTLLTLLQAYIFFPSQNTSITCAVEHELLIVLIQEYIYLFIWVMSLKIPVSRSHTVAMAQNAQALGIGYLRHP